MDRQEDPKPRSADALPRLQLLAPEAPDALEESAALLEQTREVQSEQTAQIESSPLAVQYSAALIAQIEAKHDQAERIASKLDLLLQRQSAALQQTQSTKPGIFSLPGAHARWQERLRTQQDVLQRLQGRLEMVREIKDGMGFQAPRIEDACRAQGARPGTATGRRLARSTGSATAPSGVAAQAGENKA